MIEFLDSLVATKDEELLDFCRKHALHGHPKVFDGAEKSYYEFRKRIAPKFDVNFHEILITGSAKLGFSPFKEKPFDLDSDIDVAVVSSVLFDRVMAYMHEYQLELRNNRKSVTQREVDSYHSFLEYVAMGWIRPDLLPTSFRVDELKRDWFDFFDSLSNGKSEVGNYKVSGGVFKSYPYSESRFR